MISIKKSIAFAFILIALTAFALGAIGESSYRTLKSGSYGDDVLAVKNRLYDLGFFTNNTFNNRYTDDTVKRVKSFEAACGLPQTGVMTPSLQVLLFSDDAMNSNGVNVSGITPALSEYSGVYRVIDANTEGDDVLALKQKLKNLGYFSAKAETGVYNDALAAAIISYQHDIGMEENGIADEALQEAVYGPVQAVLSGQTAVVPSATVAPIGPAKAVALPLLNDQGFLADPNAEAFIYADRGDGHWYYITQDVYVEIIRYENEKQRLTWFETEIRCTPDSLPQAFLAPGSRADGHNYITPVQMGKAYGMIFGITDDFYGYRWYNRSQGLKQGIIIRNGEIKAEETQAASSKKWPYLEILALFSDGSMKAYESDEYTAQQYIDMGAVDTFAFGPILVRDGMINQELYDKSVARYTDEDPRMAMGCIEPCHYMIITAKGRTNDSRGVTMSWMAERFYAMGCKDAMNLDGGGTAALYFDGDVLNKVENSQNLRDISSMFGFAMQ
ncbi:MAG: phosphodiester glycosidase family protein [Clostridia bacterium]|nr:phosphodiester glycosidase family protein [Clostridia bacterium]